MQNILETMRSAFHRKKRIAACAMFGSLMMIWCGWLFIEKQPSVRAQTNSQSPAAEQKTASSKKTVPPKLSSHVILIAINGLRADYLSEQNERSRLFPFLRSLREKGASTQGIESVYPSTDGPAYASIATGMLPTDHGITADFQFNESSAGTNPSAPASNELKAETIWEAANRAGLVTAISEFASTEHQKKGKDKAEALLAAAVSADEERVAKTISAIEKKLNLLALRLESFDLAQRQFDRASKEFIAAASRTDDWIKQIHGAINQAGLANEMTSLIVAPYGFAPIENQFNPNVALAKKEFLRINGQGEIVSWRAVTVSFGGSAAVLLKDSSDENLSREVEAVFREIHEKPHSPIWRIISRREISRLGADSKVAFYLEAAPGYAISNRAKGDRITKAETRGTNGYLPQRFEMRGVFVAAGKGIKGGAKLEYARLIDLAPTIARLLGCEIKPVRGRVLSEILSQ